MNNVTILGATGSIGTSTLDVMRRNADKYKLFAATGAKNASKMLGIIEEFAPNFVVMTDPVAYEELRNAVSSKKLKTEVLFGSEALTEVVSASEVDSVMSSIVGAAGLKPTLAAAKLGKKIYLANKESLVMSGHIFIKTAHEHNAQILPVDSEHNAIFQCLTLKAQEEIGRCNLEESGINHIILTGSGGPFRDRDLSTFDSITPKEAVNHPNWSMGQKISVDSATMMNKGLEFIEAKWLFNVKPEQIKVVIHPESVIHSMVQYRDGSVLAQLGAPDMRTPIARAMAWPQRIESGVDNLDFFSLKSLTFRDIDYKRYPCLKLAIDACYTSQAMTTAVNAANEVAVAKFLANECKFTDIYEIVVRAAQNYANVEANDIDAILEVDSKARMDAIKAFDNL